MIPSEQDGLIVCIRILYTRAFAGAAMTPLEQLFRLEVEFHRRLRTDAVAAHTSFALQNSYESLLRAASEVVAHMTLNNSKNGLQWQGTSGMCAHCAILGESLAPPPGGDSPGALILREVR